MDGRLPQRLRFVWVSGPGQDVGRWPAFFFFSFFSSSFLFFPPSLLCHFQRGIDVWSGSEQTANISIMYSTPKQSGLGRLEKEAGWLGPTIHLPKPSHELGGQAPWGGACTADGLAGKCTLQRSGCRNGVEMERNRLGLVANRYRQFAQQSGRLGAGWGAASLPIPLAGSFATESSRRTVHVIGGRTHTAGDGRRRRRRA